MCVPLGVGGGGAVVVSWLVGCVGRAGSVVVAYELMRVAMSSVIALS